MVMATRGELVAGVEGNETDVGGNEVAMPIE